MRRRFLVRKGTVISKNPVKELIQFFGFIVGIGWPGIIGLFRVSAKSGNVCYPIEWQPCDSVLSVSTKELQRRLVDTCASFRRVPTNTIHFYEVMLCLTPATTK